MTHFGKSTESGTESGTVNAYSHNRAVLYRELYSFLTTPVTGILRPPPASALDLPRPLARGLVHFYSLLKQSSIPAADDALADQVALAVAGWFASIWEDLRASAPWEDLGSSRPGLEEPSPDRLDAMLERALLQWPEDDPTWRMLQRHLRKADDADSRLHRGAVCHRYVEARRYALRRQRDTRRERAIRLVANPLADHLNELIPVLKEQQQKAVQVFGISAHWEILRSRESQIRWDVLFRHCEWLKQAPGLLNLCRSIVHGMDGGEPRLEEYERTVPVTIRRERDRGLGDVTGLIGDAVVPGTITPHLSLLAFPETEELFDRKFAERSLLRLQHRRRETVTTQGHRVVKEQHLRRRTRGRVIACIDTSGSMRGLPEQVARATILGMVREAIPTHRELTFLLYTHQMVTLAVNELAPSNDESPIPPQETDAVSGSAPPVVPEILIEQLSDLLASSLAEGTDIAPAMEEALTILEGEHRETVSDVVVVSDMRIPRIPPRHLNRMYNVQREGHARFHCLTINEEPLQDPLNVFDYRWFFNTGLRASFSIDESKAPIGFESSALLPF